jgi:hypothetical protein
VIVGTFPFEVEDALLFGIETAELLGVAFELLDTGVAVSEEESPGRDALLAGASGSSEMVSEELISGVAAVTVVLLQSASK